MVLVTLHYLWIEQHGAIIMNNQFICDRIEILYSSRGACEGLLCTNGMSFNLILLCIL